MFGLAASPVICSGRSPSGDAGAAASYVLSRTLVPTLATICAQSHVHGSADEAGHAKPSRNPLPAPARLRAHVRKRPKTYLGLLQLCLRKPDQADRRSFASACCHSALRPISARTSSDRGWRPD